MSVSKEIEEKIFTLGGKRIHYLEAGKGDPLVLIHGWLASSNVFERIIPVLAEKFYILAPDLPGCGFEYMSEELDGEHMISTYVDFCHAFIQEQNLKKSWGGGFIDGGHDCLRMGKEIPTRNRKNSCF